ncbi:serine/threonine protein kinase [Streptomyces viridochromogenes]|uniref:serine/threonine protein kinase n=1 Tax=Streptomyces viridochromogenes TaxID=1938 RepID=UPI00068FC61A|nr:serine/threonine-protein kinase [Streptomyces viridochromogenes]
MVDGRFELAELVYHGGNQLWSARDRKFDRAVAIKVLGAGRKASRLSEVTARFRREAALMRDLHHPSIPDLYAFESGLDQDGEPLVYAVMELVEGYSLAELLASGRPRLSGVVAWAVQIAEALQYVHQRGVVHGDLKPGNIMITSSGGVKLLDFGIAYVMGDPEAGPLSQGTVAGTPGYMAPEQAGAGRLDGRTDLYALGCVLYSMLTREPPFKGLELTRGLLALDVHEKPPLPSTLRSEIPPDLDELVMDLMEPEPQNRPSDAGVVVKRLWGLAADMNVGLISRLGGNNGTQESQSEATPDAVTARISDVEQAPWFEEWLSPDEGEGFNFGRDTPPPFNVITISPVTSDTWSTFEPGLSSKPDVRFRASGNGLSPNDVQFEAKRLPTDAGGRHPGISDVRYSGTEAATNRGFDDPDEDVAPAAASLDAALARLFLRLGPPPEPVDNERAPVGSDDGGAQR